MQISNSEKKSYLTKSDWFLLRLLYQLHFYTPTLHFLQQLYQFYILIFHKFYILQVFTSWMHFCAVRLFSETILRYGLPPSFLVFQPNIPTSNFLFFSYINQCWFKKSFFKKKNKINFSLLYCHHLWKTRRKYVHSLKPYATVPTGNPDIFPLHNYKKKKEKMSG